MKKSNNAVYMTAIIGIFAIVAFVLLYLNSGTKVSYQDYSIVEDEAALAGEGYVPPKLALKIRPKLMKAHRMVRIPAMKIYPKLILPKNKLPYNPADYAKALEPGDMVYLGNSDWTSGKVWHFKGIMGTNAVFFDECQNQHIVHVQLINDKGTLNSQGTAYDFIYLPSVIPNPVVKFNRTGKFVDKVQNREPNAIQEDQYFLLDVTGDRTLLQYFDKTPIGTEYELAFRDHCLGGQREILTNNQIAPLLVSGRTHNVEVTVSGLDIDLNADGI